MLAISFSTTAGVLEDIQTLEASGCEDKSTAQCARVRLLIALAKLHLAPAGVFDANGVYVGDYYTSALDPDVVALRKIEEIGFPIQVDSYGERVGLEIPVTVAWTGLDCTGTPYLRVLESGAANTDKGMAIRPVSNDVVFVYVDEGTAVVPGSSVTLKSRISPETWLCDNHPENSPFPYLQMARIVEIVSNTTFPTPFHSIDSDSLIEDGKIISY